MLVRTTIWAFLVAVHNANLSANVVAVIGPYFYENDNEMVIVNLDKLIIRWLTCFEWKK